MSNIDCGSFGSYHFIGLAAWVTRCCLLSIPPPHAGKENPPAILSTRPSNTFLLTGLSVLTHALQSLAYSGWESTSSGNSTRLPNLASSLSRSGHPSSPFPLPSFCLPRLFARFLSLIFQPWPCSRLHMLHHSLFLFIPSRSLKNLFAGKREGGETGGGKT